MSDVTRVIQYGLGPIGHDVGRLIGLDRDLGITARENLAEVDAPATVAIAVCPIRRTPDAAPGLLTMRDLPNVTAS